MTIEVRPSRPEDVQALKDRLREADAKEVIAEGNASVEDCLAQSRARSLQSFTVGIDEIPVAMFGIVPDSILGPTARIWFLGTEDMSKIKKSFMRQSRHIVAGWLARWSVLWNTVPVDYTGTIKWLAWLGAEFCLLPDRDDFLLFRIRRF